jgi:hypothetical protein
MTLQDLSNIAQVVNSIAVVVTIVYLATQVRLLAIQARENTRLAQLTLQENFTSAQQETCLRVAENPEMYRIWMVGTTQDVLMSDEDRERFGFLLYGQMYRYYMMYQAQALEPMELNRGMIQIDRLASMKSFQSWWGRQWSGFDFDPKFVEIVNDRIAVAKRQAMGSTGNDGP